MTVPFQTHSTKRVPNPHVYGILSARHPGSRQDTHHAAVRGYTMMSHRKWLERLGTSRWLAQHPLAQEGCCENKQAIRTLHEKYTNPLWRFMDNKGRVFKSREVFICAICLSINRLVFCRTDKQNVEVKAVFVLLSNFPVNV